MIEKKEREETWEKKLHFQEKRLWEITDSMKYSNTRITGIPEGVKKERSLEEISEQIVADNFSIWQRKQAFVSKRQRGPLSSLTTTSLCHVMS